MPRIAVMNNNFPIYDCFDERYKSPFGALKQYSSCKFTLKFTRMNEITDPFLVVQPPGLKDKYVAFEVSDDTDPVYITYSCEYEPQDIGLHYYHFVVMQHGHRRYIKREGANIGGYNGNELFQLTVYDPALSTPDWLKGGVMYQIFPDRYAKAGGIDASPVCPAPIDRVMHSSWNAMPVWEPNRDGMITNNDYFGGNLKGIEEKLPYIASLGVTVIYLNPIFESHENHRYNTANYEKIDRMLGTEEDFVSLCKTAKSMGIRIILDGVFSHTGADSIYFNKFGRYGEHSGAYRDPESPYRDWYCWIDYPHVYESWWGMTTLPNVNENNPTYTEYICGKDGIVQKWLDLGASGWRLDVADELPDEFIDALHKSVKAKGEDKVIYGEVWEDATNKESYGIRRRYLLGGQLDSVMNYPFKELILKYIKHGSSAEFCDGVMTILEHYPKPSVDILMNFISTHDIERAITRLAGKDVEGHDRRWQAENGLNEQEYVFGIALLQCAMVLQFFLPGVPCIYYGDEAGQEGYRDPFNRRTYPWGMENMALVEFLSELSRIRRSCKVFEKGSLRIIDATPRQCIFSRIDREIGEIVTIYINRYRRSARFKIIPPTDDNIIAFEVLRPTLQREAGYLQIPPYDYAAVKYTITVEN